MTGAAGAKARRRTAPDESDSVDTHVLGISAYFHDSAAALLSGGRIVAAAQEERFTRRKGDPRFPRAAVAACLREAGLAVGDLDHVVYYEKPYVKLDRILATARRVGPGGWAATRSAWPVWASRRLDLVADIRRHLGAGLRAPVSFADHHESHAASAFFPSPYDSAAILTLDAVGEWATSSIGVGRGSRIQLLCEQRFPHSLGMLYSAFTAYLGFTVNSGEYKVMGLAPYGDPRFTERILEHLVTVADDGSLRVNLDHLPYDRGAAMTSASFSALLGGPPRPPESPFTQRHLDVAASVQRVCELVVLRAARHAAALTGERHLVMAGGVALNCVANSRLLREGPFEELWVQPAAGDAGGALGAALLQCHHVLGQERKVELPDAQKGSLLGPSFSSRDIGLFLEGAGARYERVAEEPALLDRVAGWLDGGKVVGWFQGRMEYGPRALGARSILGDARSPQMQRTVNTKIKFRESFRPFAPSVLAEHAAEVFDLPPGADRPYMVTTARVRRQRRRVLSAAEQARSDDEDLAVRVAVPRSDLPAITHVDHSARLQTVDAERHGRYHRLLERFHRRTGCPVILNTSFNVRGEPIVHSPQDAYRCFLATDMDCLVLEDHVLEKADQPPVAEAARARARAAARMD